MIFLQKKPTTVRGEKNMLEKTDFHKYLYLNCWWTLPAVIFINVLIIYAIHFMNNWKYIGAIIFYKLERQLYSQLQTYFLSVKETKCTGTMTFHVIYLKASTWWSSSPELMLKLILPSVEQYFTPCLHVVLRCTGQLKTRWIWNAATNSYWGIVSFGTCSRSQVLGQ